MNRPSRRLGHATAPDQISVAGGGPQALEHPSPLYLIRCREQSERPASGELGAEDMAECRAWHLAPGNCE
ncbi:uncharacterized protein METZ01_LOCUS113852, partial [marine metagenome]